MTPYQYNVKRRFLETIIKENEAHVDELISQTCRATLALQAAQVELELLEEAWKNREVEI